MRGLIVVLLASCGRLGFDESQRFADGPPAGLSPPLISVDPSTLGPFGPATLIRELSSPSFEDDDPALTRDQLEIFFDRGEGELFTARRTTIEDPWPAPTPITELNTAATEEHPHVSADNLRLYFTSGRGGNQDLYVSTRATRDSRWDDPVRLDDFNTDEDDDTGGLDAAETTLVLSSDRGGLSQDNLFEARRADAGAPWGAPQEIAELAGGQIDTGAHLDDFGLVLHYQRGATIVWTQRATHNSAWQAPITLDELDALGDLESDPWLSPDLRTIYFSLGSMPTEKDLYMATR